MSRRPGTDKTATNLKSLLKLPANRICADCKRNKLPRWASWNLGIFICIRCSGIHRGMGTHISRVKSVDLDSWTDEQFQSMVKWGNSKANKYWEANLAPGHIPSEAKIENFIRTKYETKRWVMDGAIPDPSTLEDSDDDNVPLKVVQQKLEQKSACAAAAAAAAPPSSRLQPNFDLIGDSEQSAAKSNPEPQPTLTSAKPADSLLGLDFLAPGTSAPPRPSSVNSDNGKSSTSRPDLNRSILSLYSSAPKQSPHPQSPPLPSFGQPAHQQQSLAFGDLNDSFNNFGIGNVQNSTPAPPPKPSPFANLTVGLKKSSATSQISASGSGGFFSPQAAKPSPATTTTFAVGDLFDFGSSPTTNRDMNTTANNSSRSLTFDDDSWVTPAPTISSTSVSSNAWVAPPTSSSNAWGTSSVSSSKPNPKISGYTNDEDWGDFDTGSTAPRKSNVGTGLDDDLFGNVWK